MLDFGLKGHRNDDNDEGTTDTALGKSPPWN